MRLTSNTDACHHHHGLFRICWCISAFCLDEKVCWRTSVLCTHIHEFLYIPRLFHFIYFIVISNIWFSMLDVIIGRHTRNCQIRTHIHTGYTHTKKKLGRVGKKGKKEEREKKRRGGQDRMVNCYNRGPTGVLWKKGKDIGGRHLKTWIDHSKLGKQESSFSCFIPQVLTRISPGLWSLWVLSQFHVFLHSASECVLARDRHILQLEIILDLPFGFPINNIIFLSCSNFCVAGVAIISLRFLGMWHNLISNTNHWTENIL